MLTGPAPRPSVASSPASHPSEPAPAPVAVEHEAAEAAPSDRFGDVERLGTRLDTLSVRLSALSPFRDGVALESELREMRRRLAAISWDPSRNARR